MTSPQVSEAEVEAAARPIAETMYRDYKSAEGYATISDCDLSNASPTTVEMWMSDARPVARAALTAAAQVRERQKEQQASLVQATTEPAETSRDHPITETEK